jgi:Fe-coproporphyrin III synthase
VAEFAARNGASLLQIHPLELAGRAGNQMVGDTAEDDVLAKVYLLAFALEAKYGATMRVQLDLLYRDHLREEPSLIYAAEALGESEKNSPAQSLGLIVLEPDGTVVPVSFGFSRRYKICNVKERGLAGAWPGYVANGFLLFKSLCRQVWDELSAPEAPLLSNWHEVIVSRSHATDVISMMNVGAR